MPLIVTRSRCERARFLGTSPEETLVVSGEGYHESEWNINRPRAISLGKLNPSRNPRHCPLVHSLNQRRSTKDVAPASEICRLDTTLTILSALWPKPSRGGTLGMGFVRRVWRLTSSDTHTYLLCTEGRH